MDKKLISEDYKGAFETWGKEDQELKRILRSLYEGPNLKNSDCKYFKSFISKKTIKETSKKNKSTLEVTKE